MAKERVLVVDDEEGIREACQEFLECEGYEVTTASDGARALEIFSGNDYDLVFMDIRMPGIDGIETLRRMKKSKPGVKVIVVSGLPEDESFDRAMAVSEGAAEGFIPKPFKPKDLREALKNLRGGEFLPSCGLTAKQMDALGTVGKTGASRASQPLSKLLGRAIEVSPGQIRVLTLSQIHPDKDAEIPVFVILKCSGNISGMMAVILPRDGALSLAGIKDFDEKGQASLKAVGEVMAEAYLSSVGEHLGLKSSAACSGFVFSKEKAVLEGLRAELSGAGEYVLGIETGFDLPKVGVGMKILLMPDLDSLLAIFKKTGGFLPA